MPVQFDTQAEQRLRAAFDDAAQALHHAKECGDSRLVDLNHEEADRWLDRWRATHPIKPGEPGDQLNTA